MKIVLFDYLYDTKQMTEVMIQGHGQHRLDRWLGKDKVKFEVQKDIGEGVEVYNLAALRSLV